MFISIIFTETSIDETNKTQQKVRGSKFMFKISTIHANTCIQTTTPLRNRWWLLWQCPVLVLRSCTSWNQGLRSTVLLPEYSSSKYVSAGYPLCFRGLLRFSARLPRWGISTSCMWHMSPCCRERETPEFIPREIWPPNSPDLNLVDYSICGMLQERVYHSRIHDVNELKERLLSEWRLLIHTVMRLRSGVVVCMHVFAWMVDILNINSEPLTFCCVLFVSSILVSVNVWSI